MTISFSSFSKGNLAIYIVLLLAFPRSEQCILEIFCYQYSENLPYYRLVILSPLDGHLGVVPNFYYCRY